MISYPDPRQYPVAFATAVLRILSDLKKYREAFPKAEALLPAENQEATLDVKSSVPFDKIVEAGLCQTSPVEPSASEDSEEEGEESLGKEKLLRAAKARIDRMCAEKEKFIARLEITVTMKNSADLIIEEAWHSRQEMAEDLGWSEQKVKGAVRDCEARGSTHVRRNVYDNELEYWVRIKESGKRKQKTSYEEVTKKQKGVTDEKDMPKVPDAFKDFGKIQDYANRNHSSPTKGSGPGDNKAHKYTQEKECLMKFMDSMMARTSKLRALSRELSVATLENEIKNIEAHYDACQEAMVKADVCLDEEPFGPTAPRRNAKKYFDKAEESGGPKPKASCTRAIKTARRVVQDLGEDKAGEIGRGTNLANKKAVKKHYLKMKLNFKGHSFCSRMLAAVLPRHMYLKDDAAFQALLTASCEDARIMATQGVLDESGTRYWMVCLGTCGDWPFLHKSGNLMRTYANVVKRVDQVAAGLCHLCDCGPDTLPFERFATRRPDWLPTMNATCPFQQPPAAARIPHPIGRLAETFHFDLFHCWHLGVGRNFCGTALVLLSDLQQGNIEERFDAVTSLYKEWCRQSSHSPIISRFHKDSIQWSSTSDYPTATWFKGGITTNVVLFFESCDGMSDEPLFRIAIQAAQAINEFFRLLYSSDVWLAPEVSTRASQLLFRFLRRYQSGAEASFRESRTLFVLQPKLHPLQHIAVKLWQLGNANKAAINPLVYATQVSEDFVGRQSRLSRRVAPQQVIRRVLERYLVSAHAQFVEAGYVVMPRK
ncbi:unnamed protein product [Symbiodinium sp. KB8]|nr:unnamed protein product [Symbiodinium sp. KB8]